MNRNVIEIINDSKDLEFDVKDNEEVIVNYYNSDAKDISINIKQRSNSKFVLNFVSLENSDAKVIINGLISGNNNINVINVRTISQKGISTFDVNVKVENNTKNNEIIEDLKGINDGGGVTLLPILEIDTNEVNASHFATVGNFDKNQIFYLLSKGVSENVVYDILKRSFLYGLFNKEFIEKIEKE